MIFLVVWGECNKAQQSYSCDQHVKCLFIMYFGMRCFDKVAKTI